MTFPITLWDVGMLSATSSIAILLVTEIVSPHYGKVHMIVDVKKLRIAGIAFILAFVVIAIVNITSVIKI